MWLKTDLCQLKMLGPFSHLINLMLWMSLMNTTIGYISFIINTRDMKLFYSVNVSSNKNYCHIIM